VPGTVLAPVVFVQGCFLNWLASFSARQFALSFLVRAFKFNDARYLLIP